MKLYELSVGEKFEFISKHRIKTFQIKERSANSIVYVDLGNFEERITYSNRKAFYFEVRRVLYTNSIEFTIEESRFMIDILNEAYKLSSEHIEPEVRRSTIDKIYKKINNS